jgi:hypothetical protein
MATSEIGKLIDRIALEALGAPLEAGGYRRRGRTWRRVRDGAIQVVHVQASRWNADQDGGFHLDAGVYFPAVPRATSWCGSTAPRR